MHFADILYLRHDVYDWATSRLYGILLISLCFNAFICSCSFKDVKSAESCWL